MIRVKKGLLRTVAESREDAWTRSLELTRRAGGLSPGARWLPQHYRMLIDAFDILWPSTAPLRLQSRWIPCAQCSGSGGVDGQAPPWVLERLAGSLHSSLISSAEFQVLLRWSRESLPCPECAGEGWVQSPTWHPLSPGLAWQIAWLGGLSRQSAVAQGGALQPWSTVNWALCEWELKRISPASTSMEEAARVARLAGVPAAARRLAEVARSLGRDLKGLSPQGWQVLARRARVANLTPTLREKALELSREDDG